MIDAVLLAKKPPKINVFFEWKLEQATIAQQIVERLKMLAKTNMTLSCLGSL
jgi:hypothetical protein